MKKITLIILLLLITTSCSIDFNDSMKNKIIKLEKEHNEQIIENDKLLKENIELSEKNTKITENNIFENNLKCISNRSEIDKYIQKYIGWSWLTSYNLKWDSIIFYSPKSNSCLFSIWTVFSSDDKMYYNFNLIEDWTYNEIINKKYECWKKDFSCPMPKVIEMEKIVEKYKS